MRIRGALLAAAVVSAPSAPAPAGEPASLLFRLADSRLTELSGLAVGHRSPSVLYAQNDSGDSARFFALDRATGAVRAVCTVPGATNVDWEDLATGPDAAGVPSVWLADLGDNGGTRAEVRIYRVDEPAIGSAAAVTTGPPDVWRLRYPDGPHDAESLVADPVRHRLYVITKALLGRSEVFAVPAAPAAGRVQAMTRVGTVRFGFTGTPGGPNVVGQLTATGAGVSADGSVLAVRTYTDAYLWPVSGGDVAGALRATPTRVPLPAQPQGEGIAVAGDALLIDSEGLGSAVYRVPLPSLRRPGASAPPPVSRTPVVTAENSAQRPAGRTNGVALLAGGAGVVLLAGALALGRRRRRAR
ncbi:MAG TPA: hypothetical protein VMB79_15240 [Jatrophihabitans sp.]|nr:hypothetical protein [Jatrophihabitans sp.]